MQTPAAGWGGMGAGQVYGLKLSRAANTGQGNNTGLGVWVLVPGSNNANLRVAGAALLLTKGEVALLCRVEVRTVDRWVAAGKLRCYRERARKCWRVGCKDVRVGRDSTDDSIWSAQMTMLDWNEYRQQLANTIAEIGKTAPELTRGYKMLVASRATTSALDAKTRELVALAVAVTLRCDGCITTHVELARKQGASSSEIVDALGIAVMVNAGAALVYSARTVDAFQAAVAGSAGSAG